MARYDVVTPDRILTGSKPLAVIANQQEVDLMLAKHELSKCYLVEFPGGLYGLYPNSSVIFLQNQESNNVEIPPLSNQGNVEKNSDIDEKVNNTSRFVAIPNSLSNEEEIKTYTIRQEALKKDVWVKPTPDIIRVGRRVRCIVGSNSGREATIVNVVREGQPDAETQSLMMQGVRDLVLGNSDGTTINQTLLGQMQMRPLHSRPDNVTLEWIDPKEETTNVNTVVSGRKLNTKSVTAPVVLSTVTKAKICSDYQILMGAGCEVYSG